MGEKCLIAASLAALACHPSATIKCFKPKTSTTSSPQKEKPKSPPLKKVPSKSKKKLDPHENSSSAAQSNTNIPSPIPHPSTSKADKLPKVVSELVRGDPSICIVETKFRSGWPKEIGLTIQKVLEVNHSASVLNKFEEYRKKVKFNAGNEVLRFQGALITCSLGTSGYSRICDKKCCGVCRLITASFRVEDGPKSVHESSWKAHEKVTNEYVTKRVRARKAIVLCQVIAGRVARYHRDGEDGGFDSAVGSTGNQSNGSEELLGLNPRAVLPCFVVLYEVNYFP